MWDVLLDVYVELTGGVAARMLRFAIVLSHQPAASIVCCSSDNISDQ